jgi:hypothetical protein
MSNNGINIFNVDSHISEISEALHQQLIPDFKSYGLSLERFFVITVAKPEGERAYERYKELHLRQYADVADAQIRQAVGTIEQEMKARQTVIEAQSLAQKRQIEGYTYEQERGYTIAENIAKNEGVGNFSNMGIGLGMMGGVAGGMGAAVAGITSQALDPIMPNRQQDMPKDSFLNPAAGFDAPPLIDLKLETNPLADDKTTFQERVDKLNYMKEKALLSEEKFNAKLEELLNSI